jgi:hypothetical protein
VFSQNHSRKNGDPWTRPVARPGQNVRLSWGDGDRILVAALSRRGGKRPKDG